MSNPDGRRVVVVSGDPLPLPGLPTSGAGLRAWQLGQGLMACGHSVTFLVPLHVMQRFPEVVDERVQSFGHSQLCQRVQELQADVVVFQHWSQVSQVKTLDIPVALDLHGPVLLEITHQDKQRIPALIPAKIDAIARADFLSCAGVRQRAYFYAWMLLAGYDMRTCAIEVIPVACAPCPPERHSADEVIFVYGGIFLPWQDPVVGLTTLVETLQTRQQGRLQVFAGSHPVQSLSTERLNRLIEQLRASPRVEVPGLVPHDRMLEMYKSATVAFDLMAPNPERELAFTTRTVEYLWCGLPVVYNNYAELSEYISAYNAGWIVDPADHQAIRQIIEAILDAPSDVAERSSNAQRLVRERLNWVNVIEPLDRFCRNPCRKSNFVSYDYPGNTDAYWSKQVNQSDHLIEHLTQEIERKNQHIVMLETLIEHVQNGKLLRLLRYFKWR